MLDRLAGLENEYAIRISVTRRGERPASSPFDVEIGNADVYQAISSALGDLVPTLPGGRQPERDTLFVVNGGSFSYEFLPQAPDGGLVEGATPECRGPGQLLLYQKAQERLLRQALRTAPGRLGTPHTEIGLLRNCRDAEGHIYGAQENYEITLAEGPALWAWRVGIALLLPLVALQTLLLWTILFVLLVLMLLFALTVFVVGLASIALPRLEESWLMQIADERDDRLERWLGSFFFALSVGLGTPAMLALAGLLSAFGARRVRRGAESFFVSRMILSGTGTVDADGAFGLSEKAPAMRTMLRWHVAPEARGVFDPGNLFKSLEGPVMLRLRAPLGLFARRQRLQLGLADGNRCQYAEYLKIGTTLLVLDMAEAGALDDAPRVRRPVEALGALAADPGLQTRVEMRDGPARSALELQRWYLERAREFLADHEAPSMEAFDIVRLWGEALDALEEDPSRLLGRLDWVTKRYLLETAGDPDEPAVLKKIDLRYHELEDGYLQRLEDAGLAPTLVGEDEIEHATTTPPDDTPARQRGRMIRDFADTGIEASISWDEARIGSRLRGRIVRLDDFR